MVHTQRMSPVPVLSHGVQVLTEHVGGRLVERSETLHHASAEDLRAISVRAYVGAASKKGSTNGPRGTSNKARGDQIVSVEVRDANGKKVGRYYPSDENWRDDPASDYWYVKRFGLQQADIRDGKVLVFDHDKLRYVTKDAPWAGDSVAAQTPPWYVFTWVRAMTIDGVRVAAVPVLVRRSNGLVQRWCLHPQDFARVCTARERIEEVRAQRLTEGSGSAVVPWVLTGPESANSGLAQSVDGILKDSDLASVVWAPPGDAEIGTMPDWVLKPTGAPHLQAVTKQPRYLLATLHDMLKV